MPRNADTQLFAGDPVDANKNRQYENGNNEQQRYDVQQDVGPAESAQQNASQGQQRDGKTNLLPGDIIQNHVFYNNIMRNTIPRCFELFWCLIR